MRHLLAHHDHSIADLVVGTLGALVLLGLLIFFLSYVGFKNFLKYPGGRAVAGLVGALLFISATNVLFLIFGPDYFARDVVRVIAWLAAVVSVSYLNVVLFRGSNETDSMSMQPRDTTGPTRLIK